jgi:(4S)-4-hydroxy-5-phosphonooxypentane-2,3-dione isomerase
MILRLVKMHFKADQTATFLAFFDTIQDEIRRVPGVINLKLYQDKNDPNIIFTHSTWLNMSSLDAYKKSDLFGKVWPRTKAMFASEAMAWSLKLK